jgi:hypothetical protein
MTKWRVYLGFLVKGHKYICQIALFAHMFKVAVFTMMFKVYFVVNTLEQKDLWLKHCPTRHWNRTHDVLINAYLFQCLHPPNCKWQF